MDFTRKGTQHKQDDINSSTKRVSNKLLLGLFRVFIVIAITLAVIGIFLVSGFVKGLLDTSPDISKLDVVPNKFPTKIYDSNGKLIQELKGAESNREYVKIGKIPNIVQNAFISIEDERFYEHNGIDIKGIFRASFKGLSNGFSQGASTLTQQLIKNQMFDAGMESTLSAKIERKIQEQYLAIKLENKLSKKEILEYYLNTINLGAGTYGVQTASKEYFDKSVSKLTVSEAAVIASITQQPTKLNPIEHPDANKKRMLIVLDKMYNNKYITKKEYEDAKKDDVYSRISAINLKRNKDDDNKNNVNSYYVDAVYLQVLNDLVNIAKMDETTAKTILNSGGLKIYTTLDSNMQNTCDEVTNDTSFYPNTLYQLDYQISVEQKDGKTKNYSKEHLENYFKETKGNSFNLYFRKKEDADKYIKEFKDHVLSDGSKFIADNTSFTLEPQVSFLIMDQSDGAVKAMVGGRGTKTGSLSFNRVTDAQRQPGSTFKVVSTFLPALDKGIMTLASVQDDTKYYYPDVKNKEVKSWRGSHKGLVTMREAIWDSNNVATVKSFYQVTPASSKEYLTSLGISTLVNGKDESGSIALGGLDKGVYNLELTAAYAAIANGGTYNKPYYYTKVLDSSGKVLLEHKKSTKKVMKETTAWLLTNAMEDVLKSYGTGSPAYFSNMHIAGKTGTTTGKKDLWFTGFTPYYTATIWSGYDKNDRDAGGSSSSYHKKIWKKIMSEIHKNLDNKDFSKPNGITSASICTKCGKLASAGLCENAEGAEHGKFVKTEYFASGTVPSEYCSCHQKIKICTITGNAASEFCPTKEAVYLIKDEHGGTADSKYMAPTSVQTTCTSCNGSNIIDQMFGIDQGGQAPSSDNQENKPVTIPSP